MAAAQDLKPEQEKMINMYCQATGQTKDAIKLLMKGETEFTPEQCVSFGFAKETKPKKKYKALAFFGQPIQTTEKTDTDMSKEKLSAMQKIIAAANEFLKGTAGENPREGVVAMASMVAMMVETDKGKLVTPYEDGLLVGDEITMEDGSVPADGDYVTTDGWILGIKDGYIATMTEEGAAASDDTEANAKVAELEAKVAELQAQLTDKEEQDTMIAELQASVDTLSKKVMASKFQPKESAQAFRTPPGTPKPTERVTAQAMEDRRAQYKQKNK
jgi:hypothetical protein